MRLLACTFLHGAKTLFGVVEVPITKRLTVNDLSIGLKTVDNKDFISLTDIARYRNQLEPFSVINNWLRSRSTIEYLGLWEKLNNPDFKPIEFDRFKNEAGSNYFTLSPQRWADETHAVGLISKSGRYGGTFAHKDIAFEFASWISPEFKLYLITEFQRLKDYASYCKKTLKNGNTTTHMSLKILRIFYNDAMKEELIPYAVSPFEKVKIPKSNVERQYLNKQQLEDLENLDLSQKPHAVVHRDMFLFSVYAGGLRISDVLLLQWKSYNEETQKITKVIQKTQKQHTFKIGTKAVEIINKYKPKNPNPDAFIFSVLENPERIFVDEQFKSLKLRGKIRLGDVHLDKMGEEIKLPFKLHFHLSRHTFATNALNNGMRIEYVSKLLDYSSIRQTQVYAKIVSEELDNAVDNFIF
ncbi:KilA-N domain-containing protein [Sphingobacterium wenxiniae]|uniref:Site-specific recombinase XerD n=1 Tax=Sphingobacterium wenxiniae TaxID=683125 RepID=A0A1I6TGE5_9SPHI|nr:KilA-N domain-containing protein [Sphingobacterium wenxiniae]SFS88250.1 Site-specific recombinase XerD [Sphingobacterium wenxiniae]